MRVTVASITLAAALAVAALATAAAVTAGDRESDGQPRGVVRRLTVPCDSAVEMLAEPPAGRVLFDRVVVPSDDHVLQTVRMRWSRPFRYVAKYGFGIKAGREPVDVRVSPSWHSRLAISGASAVRFKGCDAPQTETPWLGHANIYTVERPACGSILVTVRTVSERVRLPLGRPCP